MDGVRYLDKVKQRTGAGLPLKGPKTDHLLQGTPECLSYTAEGRKCVQTVAAALMAGYNPGIIADIQFKDEVKKPTKNIRTFAAHPAVFNELARRVFLVAVKYLQENYLLSGMSIGIDCISNQWGNIYHKHKDFPYHVFWDFKGYDKSHTRLLILMASLVLLEDANVVLKPDATVEGYPALFLFSRILAVAAAPCYAWKDSIFQVEGTLASGLFDTAQINTIIQEILLTLAWIDFKGYGLTLDEFQRGKDSFTERCTRDGLGDDGMLSTFEEDFNLPFIANFLWDNYRIRMTDPDKTGVLPTQFEEVQWNFLKRGFLNLNGIVCAPLERESILKNVNWQTSTPNLTEEQARRIVTGKPRLRKFH